MKPTMSVPTSTGERRWRDHREGNLLAVAVVGTIAFGWLAVCVWYLLTNGLWLS
jgi:hypothetical protein